MSELSGKQRKHLRGEAHDLDPVVQLGSSGLTDAVAAEVDRSLEAHELIKVRLIGDRDERQRILDDLADRVDAEAVGLVGHVAVLYRAHDDPGKRRIQVPS